MLLLSSTSKYLIETGFQSFTEADISKLDALSIYPEIRSTHLNTVPTFIKLININILYFISKIPVYIYRPREVSYKWTNYSMSAWVCHVIGKSMY